MTDFENPGFSGEKYWQAYTICMSDEEEAKQLAKEYISILSLDGLSGVVKRVLHQRKMEERIIEVVTVSTRGDLDAWDEDVCRGVVERPTLNADKYWQTRTAKDYASYILMGLVHIVPELPVS